MRDSVIDTQIHAAPPGRTRQLGRPRCYTATDMPARMHSWHAPRANRWEHVRIVSGEMKTQWLGAAGVTELPLKAGEQQWIAPGSRWRVAHTTAGLRFELEFHADETVTADAPQAARAALLDGMVQTRANDPSELKRILSALAPGELILLRATSSCSEPLQTAIRESGKTLFWHPLEAEDNHFIALLARSPQPVPLAEYLGRDHAVIEAALPGALRGNAESARWMHNALARHLFLEEELLFPAYLAAGGQTGLVEGLLYEHRLLRQHMPHLENAISRRRFLLVLEAHDEKEEQIVYPDILKHLRVDTLTETIMQHPLAPSQETVAGKE